MTTISDNFGIWNDLGIVIPIVDSWTKFTNTAIGGLDLLRLTFLYDYSKSMFSYALIKSVFKVEGSIVSTKAIKVFPQPESLIINFEIPNDFKDREIYFRDFEIKKYSFFPRRRDKFDIAWQVKLEELWG